MQADRFLTGFTPDVTILGTGLSWPVVNAVLGNCYLFVIVVSLLCFVIVGVFCLVKYAPLMLHDIKNITNNELPQAGLVAWMCLVFALPLFFDVGAGILVAWWFLVLWNYLLAPEKRIVYAFIFVVLISGWLTHVAAGFITYPETQLSREMFSVQNRRATQADLDSLASWSRQHPDDAEPLNALALHAIARSEWQEGIRLLEACIDLEPANPRYYNHLAVALMGTGRTKEALKALDYAAKLKPDSVIYYYNMSRIYQSTYNFYESESAIAQASGIDSRLVRQLLDTENKVGRTRLILEKTPVSRYLARQMRPSPVLGEAADALWHWVFGLIPRRASAFLGAGFFVTLLLMSFIPRDKFSKQCARCGKVYYSGTFTKSGSPMCLQCSWLDSKAKKQEVTIVQHKSEDIRSFKAQSFRKLLRLDMVLPGLGCFMAHRTGTALIRLVVLCACLTALAMGGGVIVSFVPVHVNAGLAIRTAAVVVWASLLLRVYRRPPLRFGG